MPKSIGRRGLRGSEPERPSAALAAKVIDDRSFEIRSGLPLGTSNPCDMRQEIDTVASGRTQAGPALVGEHKLDLRNSKR